VAKLCYIVVDQPDSFDDLAGVLRCVKELGYQGAEINLTRPADAELDALARLVDLIDLPIASLMTGGNYFGEGLCLSSPDEEVRQRAVERLQECTAVAARFGAVLVVGQMQGFLSDEPDRAVGEARIEEALRRVVDTAEQHQVVVVLEPVNHLQCGFNNTLEEVMGLVERIGSPYFKPMLDTIHINIEERSLTEPFYRAGRDLGHVHLCESNGSGLGSGHLDFKAVFDALDAIDYSGYVSVKAYRQAWPASAEASIQYLRNLFG
jgi:sugar phosphate isomerase/epimerase